RGSFMRHSLQPLGAVAAVLRAPFARCQRRPGKPSRDRQEAVVWRTGQRAIDRFLTVAARLGVCADRSLTVDRSHPGPVFRFSWYRSGDAPAEPRAGVRRTEGSPLSLKKTGRPQAVLTTPAARDRLGLANS